MHADQLKQKHKILESNAGSGLLQVLAAMGMMFLLVYGILTMLGNSRLHQRKQTILSTLREEQIRIESLLNNPESWRNTIADTGNHIGGNMDCLTDLTTPCTTAISRIKVIKDAHNVTIFSNLPAWDLPSYPSDGFDDGGNPCSSFDTAGNDACPFTYKIVWQALTATKDPGLRVSGRLIYSPSANSTLKMPILLGKMNNTVASDLTTLGVSDSTKKSVSQVASDPNSQIVDPNMGKYDFTIWRSATTNVQSFRVVVKGDGSGACDTTSDYLLISRRRNFQISYDPFGLVTIASDGPPITAPNSVIRLKKRGTYECDVSLSGYGVNGFKARLYDLTNGNELGSGASYAKSGTQNTLEFNAGFKVMTDNTDLLVHQRCEAGGGSYGLGLDYPSPSGTAIIASVTCRLID